jgi:hypothetical protein
MKLVVLVATIAASLLARPFAAQGEPLPQAGTNPTTIASNTGTIARSIKAANYRRANGATKVTFRGTELMQSGSAEAKVENKNKRMEIEVKFTGMQDATKFGLEYLTFVFWAVSPQGRAENLGEVLAKNGSAQAKAVTDMQTFGMIVTAEPYFAVTQPGNMVVLEALPVDNGHVENVDATYELIGRGAYSSSNTRIDEAIFGIDPHTPRELFEARNAVRIARVEGHACQAVALELGRDFSQATMVRPPLL